MQPQPAEIRELHAQICQSLADSTRIMILYALADRPHNVGDLAEALGISQPMLSRHLKILRERGMVEAQRDGATVIYSLADKRVIQALDLMRAVLADQLAQKAKLVKGLAYASR
jgi:ArsR family transcriptional regulator